MNSHGVPTSKGETVKYVVDRELRVPDYFTLPTAPTELLRMAGYPREAPRFATIVLNGEKHEDRWIVHAIAVTDPKTLHGITVGRMTCSPDVTRENVLQVAERWVYKSKKIVLVGGSVIELKTPNDSPSRIKGIILAL